MISQLKFTLENYEIVKEQARKLYSSFGCVRCPALNNQTIYFNSEGLNHLLYKNKRPRSLQDQFMRLRVIDLAKQIIDVTTTIQEKEEIIQNFECRINKKRKTVSKNVLYYGFIAIIENKKIKVIIRKVRDSNYQFWSVIPFWKTTKHGDVIFSTFSTGDLKED